MTHPHVWHDSSACVTWGIRMCVYVWHDSFIYVTWLIHKCDMSHSHVCREWHPNMGHDSFIWVAHSHMRHDSFIFVAFRNHICDMIQIPLICVIWRTMWVTWCFFFHAFDMNHTWHSCSWLKQQWAHVKAHTIIAHSWQWAHDCVLWALHIELFVEFMAHSNELIVMAHNTEWVMTYMHICVTWLIQHIYAHSNELIVIYMTIMAHNTELIVMNEFIAHSNELIVMAHSNELIVMARNTELIVMNESSNAHGTQEWAPEHSMMSSFMLFMKTLVCHDVFKRAWHDSYICVTWLIHICNTTYVFAWCDSLIWVEWLIYMCDMTYSYVWRDSCSHVWHDSYIYVTRLMYLRDMTYLYVWHNAFICMTWLMHPYVSHD